METSDIKRAVLNNMTARYRNHIYTVNACRLYKKQNKLEYAVELLDKSQNSVMCACINEVELCGCID